MQTFVPYLLHIESAQILDRPRLGKQRVEGLQILNALTGRSNGWTNHPATKMWAGHEGGLCAYTYIMCQEWMRRGYSDSVADKILAIVEPDYNDLPSWWGDARVHISHRANLVRKFPEYYGELWVDVDPSMPYYWPV